MLRCEARTSAGRLVGVLVFDRETGWGVEGVEGWYDHRADAIDAIRVASGCEDELLTYSYEQVAS